MLQEIQVHAVTHAPLDYPKSEFTEGLSMNSITVEMLHDLCGEPRHHLTIFPEAAAIVRKVIQDGGSAVCKKAAVRAGEMKHLHTKDIDSEQRKL